MADTNGDLGGVAGFGFVLGKWMDEGDNTPEAMEYQIQDGEPHLIYQAVDDNDIASTGRALRRIIGACTSAFNATDYTVDRATIVGVPADREAHPGAARWHIEAGWARERLEDEITSEELLERVDETNELVEDADELELDL